MSAVREYSKPRQYKPPVCVSSTVQVLTSLMVNGAEHAGTVAHRCYLPDRHKEDRCVCLCGHQWMKMS